MLAAAFVSYAAPFTMEFRKDLVLEKWLPDLQQRAIPITAGCQPIELLATDVDKVSILPPTHDDEFRQQKCKYRVSPRHSS